MNATIKNSIIFVILLVGGGVLIINHYEQLRSHHLEACATCQRSAIDSSINSYRLLADTTYAEISSNKEILELVRKISSSTGGQRNRYRSMLYTKLSPMYARLRKYKLRQLHFHFPDGISMLRMHAPERFGDSLFEVRPSIKIANTELREVHGYESGRIFHGFRHVYPLMLNKHHLGSIEISTSFFQIRDSLEQLKNTNRATLEFILYKKDLWHKLFADLYPYYQPSMLHPDYVIETPALSSWQSGDRHHSLPLITEIKKKLLQDPLLHLKLNRGESCNFSLKYNYATYSIIFHSIKDITQVHAAYIIAIAPAPFIGEMHQNAVQMFLIYTVLLAAIFIFRLRFSALQVKQQQHADLLQNIADNMGIGLYTTNKNGVITFANPAALKMLGCPISDLISCHAHSKFHTSKPDSTSTCFCNEVMAKKTTLHTESAVFRRGDGTQIPVEVVCTPLYDKKDIVGTTTVFQDISTRIQQEQQLKEAQKQLQKMALQDGLTGIANRRNFDKRAREIWRSAMRNQKPLGMLMVDIDHFKLYNDLFGHQKGDQCLISVARVLELACKRPDDFVARYGGEEFAVLLPDTRIEDCIRVAKRMLSMLEKLDLPHPASPTCPHVSVSIGVCSIMPTPETRLEDLIYCTDKQLYRAKNNGRNIFCACENKVQKLEET